MKDLLAQNALLQVARSPSPSHYPSGEERNSRTGGQKGDGGPSNHQEGSGEKAKSRVVIPENNVPRENNVILENQEPPQTKGERTQEMIQKLQERYDTLS